MVFDNELSIVMPPPEKLSVTLTFECMTFKMEQSHVDHIWSHYDLGLWPFDLKISSVQFVFVQTTSKL